MLLTTILFSSSVQGQFRTYCEDTETNTKNFFPFGTLEWQNPKLELDTIDTAWSDNRDRHILEEDDGFYQVYVGRRNKFGGSSSSYFCLSSNGPLYFSACPDQDDFDPVPFDGRPEWTGVAAAWTDLRPSSPFGGPEGGNIYYRRVQARRASHETIRDIRQAMSYMNSLESISYLYVATYHKMAHGSPKMECDAGASWQYAFAYTSGPNPNVLINYGQQDWSLNSGVQGWNALHTSENKFIDFHTKFNHRQMADLANTTLFCNGDDCNVVACLKTKVFSLTENMAICKEDGDYTTVLDVVDFEFSFEVENCQTTLDNLENYGQKCSSFLNQAFEFMEDVSEITCIQDNLRCENDLLKSLASVTLSLASERSEQNVTDATTEHLYSYSEHRVSVGFATMKLPIDRNVGLDAAVYDFFKDIDFDSFRIIGENAALDCEDGTVLADNDGLYCADVNECEITPGICSFGSCTNNYGGYTCSCPTGYDWDDEVNDCIDIDECVENVCNPQSENCENTIGGFTCSCRPNYSMIHGHCISDLIHTDENNIIFSSNDMLITDMVGIFLEQAYDFTGATDFRANSGEHHRRRKRNTWSTQDIVDALPRYGCFCPKLDNVEDFYPGSRDGIDNACRKRAKCQRCSECSNASFTMVFSLETKNITCLGNFGDCDYSKCICEQRFIEEVAEKIALKQMFDPFNLDIAGPDECVQMGIEGVGCGEFAGILF